MSLFCGFLSSTLCGIERKMSSRYDGHYDQTHFYHSFALILYIPPFGRHLMLLCTFGNISCNHKMCPQLYENVHIFTAVLHSSPLASRDRGGRAGLFQHRKLSLPVPKICDVLGSRSMEIRGLKIQSAILCSSLDDAL